MTSEYWALANANDGARSKNNSSTLPDVDEQDVGQQEDGQYDGQDDGQDDGQGQEQTWRPADKVTLCK